VLRPTHIQGVSLKQLSDQFGSPLYVYDGEKIEAQVQALQQAFASVPLRIKYATKALSTLAILQLIREARAGIDTVSIGEIHVGLMAGHEAKDIMYTPSGVAFKEIEEAVALGVMVNIDSLSLLEKFGKKYGSSVPACLRINPHILAGGNLKISVGHKESKFGISIAQLPQILALVEQYQIPIVGLHVHTGSDIYDAEVFLESGKVLFDAAMHFPKLRFLDFGGGFKVAYREGELATDIQVVGKIVGTAFQEFCARYGRPLEFWIEPGKYLVSEAGYFLTTVNVVKESSSLHFLGVDSGLNHLIRPMMYEAYHEIYNLSNTAGPKATYTVVGYICETDTFGAQRELHEVKEGDVLAIKNAGAYGFTMASNYNMRLRPAEVLIWKGKAQLIRKRETFEDLIANQIPLPS